jgi:glycosyltransferase involved in cell wall biosynthesis
VSPAGGAAARGRRILVMNERDLRHPQAGGAEVHCFEIFKRLAAGGDDVTVLASGFSGAPAEETIEGVRVLRLGNRISYYAQVYPAYRRLRAATPPDVVVEDLNKFPFFARLWVAEPLVVFVHHLFGVTAFRQVALPIATATYLAERLVPRVYRGVPVIAVSPSTRDELIAGGLRADDVHMIPNGVDHELYRPGDGTRASTPTVLALGRVEPYKRNERLVDAIAALPGVRLVIAGAGTGLEAVRARVAARGIADRVELRGFIDEDEKVRLLQTAHVLATVSEKEGWGLTVLEAAACSTPAVATDVPGLRDAVRHGETGLLVPRDDAAALVTALRRMIEDAPLRERLGQEARRWAARFEWGAVTADVSAVLELARGRRSVLSAKPAAEARRA